jgi:hypothetical protein
MSTAKQAFDAIKDATTAVSGRDGKLTLNQLQAIKRDVLGWNGPIAKFRAYADNEIKTLPRSAATQKKVLKRQKADLSIAVKDLRDLIDGVASVLRVNKHLKSSDKIHNRECKAVKQIQDAFNRLVDCNSDRAFELLDELIKHPVMSR